MQITRTNDGSVRVESKPAWLTLGVSVRLGDYTIPGPGEYDVTGIQCHQLPVGAADITLIRLEDLTVAFVQGYDAQISKTEGVSNTHILVVACDTIPKVENIRSLIKDLDPGYVILQGTSRSDYATELGISPQAGATLKVTNASLPQEGCLLATLE